MSDPRITDEAVTAVALALADEVRKWPTDSYGPYDSRVGVGATFQELARAALKAALPHLAPQPVVDREALVPTLVRARGEHRDEYGDDGLASLPTHCICGEWQNAPDGFDEHVASSQADAVLALLNGTAK